MNHSKAHQQMALLVVMAALLVGQMAHGDAVTDWNVKAGEIVVEAKLGRRPPTGSWRSCRPPSTRR